MKRLVGLIIIVLSIGLGLLDMIWAANTPTRVPQIVLVKPGQRPAVVHGVILE